MRNLIPIVLYARFWPLSHVSYFLSHCTSISEKYISRCLLNSIKELYTCVCYRAYPILFSLFNCSICCKNISPTVLHECVFLIFSTRVFAVNSLFSTFKSMILSVYSFIFSMISLCIASLFGQFLFGSFFLYPKI